jgi:hypothetical protein
VLQQLVLTSKVFAIALVIALLIKYICVNLPIPPSSTNALIGVFLPPGIMILLLSWRSKQNLSKNEANTDDSGN